MTSNQLPKVTGTLRAGSDYNTLPEKLFFVSFSKYNTELFLMVKFIFMVFQVRSRSVHPALPTSGNMLPSGGTEDYLQKKVKVERTINSGSDSMRL